MARQDVFQWANRALDGQLPAILRGYKAEDQKIDAIVDSLRDDHDVRVSRETVRQWLVRPEVAQPERSAS